MPFRRHSASRPAAITAAIAAVALLSLALVLGADRSRPASAADAETAQLISYMNQYRAQNGVGALSTSSTLNANAQTGANDTAAACAYILPPGSGKKFGTTAYPTAAMVWEAWLNDPGYLPWIKDPKYHTVGVGRSASDCSFGHIWWVILSTDGPATTPQPTAPSTPPPTPTGSPTLPATPAPTQNASTTPTATAATPTPTGTMPPSDTASPTDMRTDSPSPTDVPEVGGDVDCSGSVDLFDGIEVLKVIGGANANAPCITASGPDCTGLLTANDALVLFLYLGGLPADLPDGCPAIGAVTTPTPGPSPSVTPTPTPTPTPTSDGTPDPGAAMDHCWLAPVVYDMTYHWLLEGDYTCAPDNGAAYTCNFPAGSNAVECATDTLAHYSCYVWADPGIDVPCASSLSTGGDYLCHQGESSIICTAPSAPTYVCNVADQLITCTGPATFAWSPPTPVP